MIQSERGIESPIFNSELHMRQTIPVAILGATGFVGQRLVEMLHKHPWFEIVQLVASNRSENKMYKDAVTWLLTTPIPEKIAQMKLVSPSPNPEIKIAFSSLDSTVAEEVERMYADVGIHVVTNAKSHRMKETVPLLIPEVNLEHLALIENRKNKGVIVANPNCVVIGLCIALKPLIDKFGIDKVHVTTYQATSGAGFPGVASLSILDNLIPYIADEEEKVEIEPLKIFSKIENGVFVSPKMAISASCVRVPITEGHLLSVSVSFKRKPTHEEVIKAFQEFYPPVLDMKLPSAPNRSLYYFHEKDYPQPKLHRMKENGMAVSVGQVRPCNLHDVKFFVLSHNGIRGAAGSTVLIGELLVKKGLVFW